MEDVSGSDQTNDNPTVVPLTQNPAIAVVKTPDASGVSSPAALGESITYAFTVTNTGNVTLTDVTLADPLPGLILTGGPIASLAPGASDSTTFTAAYTLTQADLDAAQVVNQATATGTYPGPGGPDTVSDLSGATVGDDDPTTVDLDVTGAINLVKTVDTSLLSDPARPGDVLTYAFKVTNTGPVTLTDVTLADPLPGITLSGGPILRLAPGATDSTTFTARYALTQSDIDAGTVSNTAVATGTYIPKAGSTATTTDISGTDVDNDLPTDALIPAQPGISLVKTADTSQMSTPTQIGDVILYRFAVTNTGNVTLTNVTVTDPLPGLTLSGGPIASLAPGESDTTTFLGTYSVSQADFDAAEVKNQATATGNPSTGPPVTVVSGGTLGDEGPTVVPLTFNPDVTASKVASTQRVIIGDAFTYELQFRSNSPGALRDVTVVDILPVGLVYTPGSARLDGTRQEPVISGRTLRWTGQTIAGNAALTVEYAVRVTGDAPLGDMENQTWLATSGGDRISNIASATVQREPEAVFDCSDIIGKVFDDRNQNGYQDAPEGSEDSLTEPGIPGVRVVTTRGVIVTTDEFGRFHVPCAELPQQAGSNFTMKLDTLSLPSGYGVTTENPRTIVVTPGKMAKLNFGVAQSRVVRVELSASAFTSDDQPSAALEDGVRQFVASSGERLTFMQLNYVEAGETDDVARRRLASVESLVRRTWGDDTRLQIEMTIQRGGGASN
ncbi:MAG: hypothetical protein NTX73_12075 [Rhodobacterales bacterium]|nr:hypothetical protein [Rhodobacterales bacterium]